MGNWVKVDAVRIKGGKIQLRNPQTFFGGERADKAGFLKLLFGTKTVSYKKDLKRGRVTKLQKLTEDYQSKASKKVSKSRILSQKEVARMFSDL